MLSLAARWFAAFFAATTTITLLARISALPRWARRARRAITTVSTASILAAAMKTTGLSDLGDERFRPGFEKLLESVEADARLTLFGRIFARKQILELVGHRLQLADYRKKHPEVAKEVICSPLFILGLPRTGTTLLYGLIAEDPAMRAPMSWEIDDPCPPPETATYETDPRIERCRKRFDQVAQLAPRFQAIHPVGALMPAPSGIRTSLKIRRAPDR